MQQSPNSKGFSTHRVAKQKLLDGAKKEYKYFTGVLYGFNFSGKVELHLLTLSFRVSHSHGDEDQNC
jgi:hypothetical protein